MKLGFIGTGKITFAVITGICSSSILYKKIIISHRNKSISSTLKKKFKKILFNFVLINYVPLKKNNSKKIYDLVVYYRVHKNKSNSEIVYLIEKLLAQKFKIIVVGDKLNIKGLVNEINLPKKKLFQIIKKSKFALNSGENSLSLFMFDCISNGVKTFVNKKKILK